MPVRTYFETLMIPLSHLPGRMILFFSGFDSIRFYFCHSIHYHLSLVVLGSPSNQEEDLGKDWLYHSVYQLLGYCFSPRRHAVKVYWIKIVSGNQNENLVLIC